MARAAPDPTARRQELLDSAARKLVYLIRQAPAEQKRPLREEAEALLQDANLLQHEPPRGQLEAWAQSLIADNPRLFDESTWALEHNLRPARCETVHELISSLIPTEGGL